MTTVSFLNEREARTTNDYVLYMDFWGTAAKLNELGELTRAQAHFVNTLAALAMASPELEIIHSGDTALAYSSDLRPLLGFGAAVMKRMTQLSGSLVLWPLRAALAQGTVRFNEPSDMLAIPNFQSSLTLGQGQVEAAKIEKSAQRGMRLFLSKSVGQNLESDKTFLVRTSNAKGLEHYELNWMVADPIHGDYLDVEVSGKKMREHLTEKAREWIEENDSYYQQLGASFMDLLRWQR